MHRPIPLPTACAALLLAASVGAAQQPPGPCPAGQQLLAHIGLTAPLACAGGECTIRVTDGGETWTAFRGEPRIVGLDPYFARSTGLREGDVIVAIDDHLIMTREGGRRWAGLAPGERTVLRVRRGDREHDIAVTPARACGPVPLRAVPAVPPGPPAPPTPPTPAPGAVDRATPAPAAIGRPTPAPAPAAVGRATPAGVPGAPPALAPRPPAVALNPAPPPGRPLTNMLPMVSRGWLGFAIQCEECGAVAEPGGRTRWAFSRPPRVYQIERGGPGQLAGLRNGDRIVSVDGIAITAPAGGAAFSAIRAGDHVRLGIERDGVSGVFERVLEAQAGPSLQAAVLDELRRASPAATRSGLLRPEARPLRFAGTIGGADIEVRGRDRVTVSEIVPGEEVEIVVGDTVVRVRVRR